MVIKQKTETGENCPMWNHRSSVPPGPLPKRADYLPERADFRPERSDFRPERAGGVDGQTDERTQVPCVLQDSVPFGAAALLPLTPIQNNAKQGNGYRWPHIALGQPVCKFSILFNEKFAFCQFFMLFNGNLRLEKLWGGRTDGRMDGRTGGRTDAKNTLTPIRQSVTD